MTNIDVTNVNPITNIIYNKMVSIPARSLSALNITGAKRRMTF
jgi:hypothetical protein